MTQPDYREKASELFKRQWWAESAPDFEQCFVDAIAQALHDAHLAGRREGIETALKQVDAMIDDYMYTHGVTLLEDVAAELRALLRGGKK